MLIVEVKKGNIEKALKDLKGKVIRTKQNAILFGKKEFTKNPEISGFLFLKINFFNYTF